jgi:hypothetical protein
LGHALLLWHHGHLLLLHALWLLRLSGTRGAIIVTDELVVLTLRWIEIWERHDACCFYHVMCVVEMAVASSNRRRAQCRLLKRGDAADMSTEKMVLKSEMKESKQNLFTEM